MFVLRYLLASPLFYLPSCILLNKHLWQSNGKNNDITIKTSAQFAFKQIQKLKMIQRFIKVLWTWIPLIAFLLFSFFSKRSQVMQTILQNQFSQTTQLDVNLATTFFYIICIQEHFLQMTWLFSQSYGPWCVHWFGKPTGWSTAVNHDFVISDKLSLWWYEVKM